MKKLNLIFVVLFLLITIFSCKKDNNKETITPETITAKWVTAGTNSAYESFEFNKSGNYIVVKNTTTKSTAQQIILFGTYTIVDNSTIELSDFGTIKITTIDNNNFNFTVILKNAPGIEIAFNSTKAIDIASSSKTDLLSRTWKLLTVNGKNVKGTNEDFSVLFSSAGTYFVSVVNPTDENDGGLAQWRWKDSNETKLCYSWEGSPTCNGEDEVDIVELTNTGLKISEVMHNGEVDLYVFEPAINTKSATLKTNEIQVNNSIKNGFLRR